MRLFIAVDLDDASRTAVSAAVAQLRDRAERRSRGLSRTVSWVEARNLHLTVHFLGEVEDRRVDDLRRALASPLDIESFGLGLGAWGVFPALGAPRVVWAGITAGLGPLEHAHAQLGERVASLGIEVDDRRYSPHLTVGRVKAPAGESWRELVEDGSMAAGCSCRVTQCTLYHSRLSSAGPTYVALAHVPFRP